MLSIDECQRILNEASAPGVEYSLEEADRLRSILYQIAKIALQAQRDEDQSYDEDEPAPSKPQTSLTLYKGLNGRAG